MIQTRNINSFGVMLTRVVLTLGTLGFSAICAGAAPAMMNYQGSLTDSVGVPRTGQFSMSFSLYADSTGGSPLWTESYETVSTVRGVFNVLLGSVTPIPQGAFQGARLWLQTVVDEAAFARRPLVSVPYALRAAVADSAIHVPGGGGESLWSPSGSNIYRPTGNVGIGTPPLNRFHIRTDDNYSLLIDGSANAIVLTPRNTGQGNVPLIDLMNGEPSGKRNIIMSTARGLEFNDVSGTSAWIFRTNNGIERMRLDGNGNLGIGTGNPETALEVAGTTKTTGFRMPTGATANYVLTTDASGNGTWQSGGGGLGGSGSTGMIAKFSGATTLANSVLAELDGKVGLGTPSPGAKLEVRGDVRAGTSGAEFVVGNDGKIATASVQTASIEDRAVTSEKAAITALHTWSSDLVSPGTNYTADLDVEIPASTVPRYAMVTASASVYGLDYPSLSVCNVRFDGVAGWYGAVRTVSVYPGEYGAVSTNTLIPVPGDGATHHVTLYIASSNAEWDWRSMEVMLVAQPSGAVLEHASAASGRAGELMKEPSLQGLTRRPASATDARKR